MRSIDFGSLPESSGSATPPLSDNNPVDGASSDTDELEVGDDHLTVEDKIVDRVLAVTPEGLLEPLS